jgi:hypothetical protein
VRPENPKPVYTISPAPRPVQHTKVRTHQENPPVQVNVTTMTPSVRKKPKTPPYQRTCYHCRAKGHEWAACPNKHLPRAPNQSEWWTPSPSTSGQEVMNMLEPRTRSTPGQQSQTYAQVCRTRTTTMASPVTAPIPRAEPAKVARLLKKMTPSQRMKVMGLLLEEQRPTWKATVNFTWHRGIKLINMPFIF